MFGSIRLIFKRKKEAQIKNKKLSIFLFMYLNHIVEIRQNFMLVVNSLTQFSHFIHAWTDLAIYNLEVEVEYLVMSKFTQFKYL